jgi:hypothetical protein
MKRENAPQPPAVVVRRHPPERLIRAMARGEVAACCTTSSCCCCLHSLGSLLGAFAGTYYPADPPGPGGKKAPPDGLRDDELDRPAAAPPAKPGPGPLAARIFWGTTAALTVLTIVIPPLIWVDSGPAIGIGLLIFILPGVLLGGSAVTAFVIAISPHLRGGAREWKRLGWITLGIVAGAVIGVLLMLPLTLR